MDEVCCDLQLNPDITGIGVRTALYAQTMLGWIMSLIWPDTFVKNSRTAYMTATALLIASFIQLETQELSLLDGIVVSLITSMMLTFSIASNSDRSSNQSAGKSVDSQKSYTRWFMQFCFVIFWGAWSFNLWRDPAHFGLRGRKAVCLTNYEVTLFIFGREVHATDPGMRNAALALVSIGFFIALCSLFFNLEQVMYPVLYLRDKGKEEEATTRAPAYEDPLVQGVHVVLQAIAIATLIYLTVATERTIVKNDYQHATRSWSYGQTIALILLLQQLMDILSTYVEKKEESEDDSGNSKQDADPPIVLSPVAAKP